jgi:uncharacterized cupin superfamily protein
VRDAEWWFSEGRGARCAFESEYGDPPVEFAQLGINVTVLEPGQTGLYHAESNQEAFLVLSGECALLVEDEERRLRPWDFFHSSPWTEHAFVGAGEGPSVILMVGSRSGTGAHYPVSELAARYGASVAEETSDWRQAYVLQASFANTRADRTRIARRLKRPGRAKVSVPCETERVDVRPADPRDTTWEVDEPRTGSTSGGRCPSRSVCSQVRVRGVRGNWSGCPGSNRLGGGDRRIGSDVHPLRARPMPRRTARPCSTSRRRSPSTARRPRVTFPHTGPLHPANARAEDECAAYRPAR